MTIEELANEIDNANDNNRAEAQAAFTEETGKELADSCHYLAKGAAERLAVVRRGEPPPAFGAYDRDEIARIYTTDTSITYDGYDLDMGADAATIDNWPDGAIMMPRYEEAEEADDRKIFLDRYEEYLYAAAVFAKSIGSAAVRPYLMAWGLSRETRTQFSRLTLSPQEALRLTDLEKAASKLLWLDATIARLPKFKAVRPRRKAPSRKRKA